MIQQEAPQVQSEPQSNYPYEESNVSSVFHLRLSTDELLKDVYKSLTGFTLAYTYNKELKRHEQVWKQIGRRKMNDRGVADVMFILKQTFSPATVSGNYTQDMYENHVFRLHRQLAKLFIVNYPLYDMKREDYPVVLLGIMNCAEMFISRLIDNKERESYIPTQRVSEVSHVTERDATKKGFSLFGGGSQQAR